MIAGWGVQQLLLQLLLLLLMMMQLLQLFRQQLLQDSIGLRGGNRGKGGRTRGQHTRGRHQRGLGLSCCSSSRGLLDEAAGENERHVLAAALEDLDVALLLAEDHVAVVAVGGGRMSAVLAVHLDESLSTRLTLQ